jgi:hypothetical protein
VPDPEPEPELLAYLEAELAGPAPVGVEAVVEAIRDRLGPGVAAVLFYGSCLRRQSCDGVLDLYALVDDYRSVHASRAAAAWNRLLPPSVFYLETEARGERLRAKYAVVSTQHFQRAASARGVDARVWSRFCQPARLLYARDPDARRATCDAVARATLEAVARMAGWMPGRGGLQRFRPGDLWRLGLRETYRAELRSEQPETVRTLYAEQAERMDRVARLASRALAAQGRLRLRRADAWIELESTAWDRARARTAWRLRRPLAKTVAVLGLLKAPATFEDWVPYALWKLERQSGARIQVSERQRRHPFLWGWPVLFRLLRQRVLR